VTGRALHCSFATLLKSGADAVDQAQRHHVDPDRQPALFVEPPVGVEQIDV